jgi:SAM-dependent methyltransferase
MGSSELQGKHWGAKAWDWAYLFEPMSKPLWAAMLDSANVRNGTRFVDLGCGGGGASHLAARRGAQVSGLDAADALIQIARTRVPEGDFHTGDLEATGFDDGIFDVTFTSLSLMFAGDFSAAIAEMKRITSVGGLVTVGVWGAPEDCEYRHILDAIASVLPPPSTGRGVFALSDRGRLEAMMKTAGLTLLDHGDVNAPFRFKDLETMWRLVSSAGPVQAAIQTGSGNRLKSSVLQAARPFQRDGGEILMNNRLRYVTAAT